jgi:hypothetical protein
VDSCGEIWRMELIFRWRRNLFDGQIP